jgi:predicted AlkP superfamily phosphohydrolase/phosphomutase
LINWEQSKAVASGQGPIYILAADSKERQTIREELHDELTGLQTPDGTPVVRGVYRSEEIYEGPYVEAGPDLVIDQAPGVHIDGGIGSETVFDDPRKWNGENTMRGIFMAYGSDIDNTFEAERISITDIGPTILHLHDQAIPEEMDGDVLTEVFTVDSDAAKRDPVVSSEIQPTITDQTAAHEDGDVSDRLKSLGYLE